VAAEPVSKSPIEQLLRAIDTLDVDAVLSRLAPHPHVLGADGQRGGGAEAVRELVSAFASRVRSSEHRITVGKTGIAGVRAYGGYDRPLVDDRHDAQDGIESRAMDAAALTEITRTG
jgi:hypothetical protein